MTMELTIGTASAIVSNCKVKARSLRANRGMEHVQLARWGLLDSLHERDRWGFGEDDWASQVTTPALMRPYLRRRRRIFLYVLRGGPY